MTPETPRGFKDLDDLKAENTRLAEALRIARDREGTFVGIIAGALLAVPLAYAFGKARGLALRPTWRQRAAGWLMDRAFELEEADHA